MDDSVARLRSAVRGPILEPFEAGYDEARQIWNGLFDRRPSLIVRCLDAADVSAVVRYALEQRCPVTVRGGGHNVAGRSIADDAILLDLGLMRDVVVDVDSRTAHAGGGCLLSDLDQATAAHDLACPAGVVSHTGLGGLALGGGYGWLARKWGLTCDHVLGAEVVLADGSIVNATESSEPELLWALRGGGGSFGIVTRFVLRLRPVGLVQLRQLIYPLDEAVDAIAAYASFADTQVRDLHVVSSLGWAPEHGWIPSALRNEPVLFLRALWLGNPREAASATDALIEACAPASSTDEVLPFLKLQARADESEPRGNRYYTKSCYLDGVSSEAAAYMVEAVRTCPAKRSAIDLAFLLGAIADVQVPSAFPHRQKRYMYTASAQWVDPRDDETSIHWARNAVEGLFPSGHPDDVYVNYAEVDAALNATAGGSERKTLEEVKFRHDPDGVFQGHHPISPRAAEGDTHECV